MSMAKNMPVVVGRVVRLDGTIPRVAGELRQAFEKARSAGLLNIIHLKPGPAMLVAMEI